MLRGSRRGLTLRRERGALEEGKDDVLPKKDERCREERGGSSHVDDDVELAIPPQRASLSEGKLEVPRLSSDAMLHDGIDTEGLYDAMLHGGINTEGLDDAMVDSEGLDGAMIDTKRLDDAMVDPSGSTTTHFHLWRAKASRVAADLMKVAGLDL